MKDSNSACYRIIRAPGKCGHEVQISRHCSRACAEATKAALSTTALCPDCRRRKALRFDSGDCLFPQTTLEKYQQEYGPLVPDTHAT